MSDKPLVYKANDLLDTYHYRASAIGGCTKALLLARLGYTPAEPVQKDSELAKRLAEGHEHEPHIVEYARDWLIKEKHITKRKVDTQKQVSVEVLPNRLITGHLDGYVDGTVIEAKAFSQSTWDTWQRKEFNAGGFISKYAWQISSYSLGTQGSPICFVVYNKDTGEYDVRYIETPPITFTQLRDKVITVEDLAAANNIPDECDNPSWLCPFYPLHTDEEKTLVADKDSDRFDAAVEWFHKAKLDRDHANTNHEAAKANLGKVMLELGMETDGASMNWSVHWVESKGRAKWQYKEIAAELGITEKELRDRFTEPGKASRYPKVEEVF